MASRKTTLIAEGTAPGGRAPWAGTRIWLILALAALAALVAAGVYAWRSGTDPAELAALGYPGVFLVMFISGCSILFPVPGQAAILAAGAIWNPVLVGVASGLGNSTGELTGYLLGRAAGAAIEERRPPRWWGALQSWVGRYGFFAIMAIAMVPNPVFDAVGLIAGSLEYPARRFWLACAIGNSVKYTALAYLGNAAIWNLFQGG